MTHNRVNNVHNKYRITKSAYFIAYWPNTTAYWFFTCHTTPM